MREFTWNRAAWGGAMCAGMLFACCVGAAPAEERGGEWLCVVSDWEPDAATARLSAQAKLDDAVRRWLVAERPESAKWSASPEHLRRLLSQPDVVTRRSEERRQRPYGTVVRVRLEAGLAPEAVDGWSRELEDLRRRRIATGLAKTVLVAIGWALLAAAVKRYDTWTRGYRRTPLAISGALAAIVLAAAAWAW